MCNDKISNEDEQVMGTLLGNSKRCIIYIDPAIEGVFSGSTASTF